MFWNLADFSLQALLKTLQSACPALHFVECAGAFTDSPLNFYLLSVRAAVQPDPQPMSQHRRGSGEERPMRGRTVGLFSLASGKMTRCTTRCIIFLLQSSSSSKSAMLVMTTGSSLPTLLILFELCCFFAFRFLVGPSTFSLLLFVFSLSFHPRCHNCCLHGCSLRCVRSRLWFICWYMYLFFASLCYSRCYSFLCSCFSVLCSYLLRCHCH